MKKSYLKIITATVGVMLLATAMIGCTKKDDSNANSGASNNTTTQETKVSGNITASGSSALKPLADEVNNIFKQKNPDAVINIQAGGSGTGLSNVSDGTVDIGNSDIFAEEKLTADQAKALVDHQVCVVGFAAVVNPKVTVDNLTKQQLIDIFTGKTTNWKDVGGADQKIVIISRPDSSGTKATFKKYALDGAKEAAGNALKEDSSGAVSTAVSQTEGSISYLASSYFTDADSKTKVKALKIDGVEMNKANITTGKYNIWSYEHMYTKGEAKDLAKAFIDFFKTDDAKNAMEKLGYIPSTDMKVKR
ncbi:phosphate ABC transporter substrate-binding protein [Clostridium sp. 19966]|uniref:phosphate ABC transporter substrate-binding protein n=1 Tax=Clostridium sp. 19966 TaxID=2768166 RepID=UPI0028E19997|nr:phosphate ABC transporter substrate-binding protein [Clostridium sp. 19966]